VVAAPPGKGYRVRKFVRRHRGVVVATVLVAGALVLGIVGTSAGLVKAQQGRREAVAARQAELEQRKLAESRLGESQATVKFLNDMLGAADPLSQGKDVTVRSVLDRASADLGGKFKDQPLVAARLHGTIGATYVGLGELRAGDPHMREALSLYQRELGAENQETCRVANAVGVMLTKEGKLSEAEGVLTKAAADEERLFGRKHEVTIEALDALSQVYALQDRRADAAILAQEVLDARVSALGKEHQDVVAAMNTMATLYTDMGRLDEAEKLFEEAASIQERVKGPEHPLTLQLKANLQWMEYQAAMAGREQDPEGYKRKLARAKELGEQVLRARVKVLGEEHPDTGTSMNNLALVYRELKMWEEADKLGARDLEVSVRKLGEGHPDTIASLANMGNSLRNRKKYDEAIVYLDRALKNARRSLPADADGLAFILGWYGSCQRDLGKFAEAEAKLIESRQIIAKTKGEGHPIAKQMALGLQMLYEAWDKAEPGKGYDVKAGEWKAKAPK
jgi:tetratricopeptide (TPR) repeat protein